MAALDPFTRKRITRFVEDHRASSGQLPTFADFEKAGFDKAVIKEAARVKLIEELYVTLTNGTVVKGFKVTQSSL